MAKRSLRNRHPTSLRDAMEACLDHARRGHNRSVDRVADLMGIPSKWALYKWLENGRLPAQLIRPFEAACGAEYVTAYIAASAHKLLIDIPTGRRVTGKDINDLQASFSAAVGILLRFYDGAAGVDEALAALRATMAQLAWHHGMVERHNQPELELGGGEEC